MPGLLQSAYAAGENEALEKLAGGPGSGVKGYNTATLDMPKSPYVSVGTRKALLDNMDFHEEKIPLASITHVAQDKYVPKKVQGLLRNPDVVKEKPIDVLKVGDCHHVIDGHHRYLAAKSMGLDAIPARVRIKADKTFKGKKKS